MANNPIFKIKEYGQSIWMDYLDRQLIESGELKNKIETRGISGITSNPKSFAKAVSNNRVYDSDIEAGIKGGKSTSEIYESLIFEDIRNACDIFRPIYDESGGTDGFVSIEVSPHLAGDFHFQKIYQNKSKIFADQNRFFASFNSLYSKIFLSPTFCLFYGCKKAEPLADS